MKSALLNIIRPILHTRWEPLIRNTYPWTLPQVSVQEALPWLQQSIQVQIIISAEGNTPPEILVIKWKEVDKKQSSEYILKKSFQ